MAFVERMPSAKAESDAERFAASWWTLEGGERMEGGAGGTGIGTCGRRGCVPCIHQWLFAPGGRRHGERRGGSCGSRNNRPCSQARRGWMEAGLSSLRRSILRRRRAPSGSSDSGQASTRSTAATAQPSRGAIDLRMEGNSG